MVRQRVPDVTKDDVERIVRRDFPGGQFDPAMAVLERYGTETWHRERARVQLAALKLSNGDLHKLEAAIETAKKDYRDVLVPAEYPEYAKTGFRKRELPVDEQDRINARDWEQYESWLQN